MQILTMVDLFMDTFFFFLIAGRTTEVEKRPTKKSSPTEFTHNIKDYLPLFHKERRSEDPDQIRLDNIKTLRRLLRKLYELCTRVCICVCVLVLCLRQRENEHFF